MSIFNVPVNKKIIKTLNTRQGLMGKDNRTPQELVFLNSNTSWVKLSSSVNIQGTYDLAKENVLLGGALSYTPATAKKREQWDLRSGVSNGYSNYNAYSNISGDEENLLGTRAMPGINSISVENIGAYGSIRKAIVTFQCWDIKQLELLEQLYMRPGYTVLLEFGRTVYLEGLGKLTQVTADDKFFTRKNIDLHVYLKELFDKSTNSGGNYDAFFGYVTNYGWSARADGGYDCRTEIISTGEILESIKVNYSAAGGVSFGDVATSAFNGHLFTPLNWAPLTSEIAVAINEEYTNNALSGLIFELYHLINYFYYSPNIPSNIQSTNTIKFPPGSLYEGSIDFSSIFYTSEKQSEVETKFLNASQANYYITLESFANLLSKFILPGSYDGKAKKGDLTGLSTKDRNYIENHPGSDLLCLFNNHMTSINPDVCMIKNDRYLDILNSLEITSTSTSLPTQPFSGMDPNVSNRVKNWIKKLVSQQQQPLGSPKIDIGDLIAQDYLSEKASNSALTPKAYAKMIAPYYQVLRGGKIQLTQSYTNAGALGAIAGAFSTSGLGAILNIVAQGAAPKQVNRSLWKALTPTSDELKILRDDYDSVDGTLGGIILKYNAGFKYSDPTTKAVIDALADANNNDPKVEDYNNKVAAIYTTQQQNQLAANKAKTALGLAAEQYKTIQSYLVKDFKTKSNTFTSYGTIGNIYVNLKYLYKLATDESLMSQDPSGNNTLPAAVFLKNMVQGIQSSLGNVNNFEVHIDPIDGIGRIIDVNYINRDGIKGLFSFEIGGNKSTVRDLKLESQIFSNQSSMIAISAQADAGRLGLNNSTLVAYNKGITDRMIAKKDIPLTYGASDYGQINNFVSSLSFIANRFLKPFYGKDSSGNSKFNVSEASAYSNSLRDIISFFSAIHQTDSKDKSFLPSQLSLTLDGISGWVIGNLFKVNDEFIPQHYKRKDGQLGYIITKINHNVVDNNWTTTIKGYPFNLDSDKSPADDDFSYTLVINYDPHMAGVGGSSGSILSIKINPSQVVKTVYAPAFDKRYPSAPKGFRTLLTGHATIEGFKPGNTPYDLNNPGSFVGAVGGGPRPIALGLRPNKLTPGGFAKFATLEDGIATQVAQIQKIISGKSSAYKYNPDITLEQYINIYAPGPQASGYIGQMIGFFAGQGLTITQTSKIADIIKLN